MGRDWSWTVAAWLLVRLNLHTLRQAAHRSVPTFVAFLLRFQRDHRYGDRAANVALHQTRPVWLVAAPRSPPQDHISSPRAMARAAHVGWVPHVMHAEKLPPMHQLAGHAYTCLPTHLALPLRLPTTTAWTGVMSTNCSFLWICTRASPRHPRGRRWRSQRGFRWV